MAPLASALPLGSSPFLYGNRCNLDEIDLVALEFSNCQWSVLNISLLVGLDGTKALTTEQNSAANTTLKNKRLAMLMIGEKMENMMVVLQFSIQRQCSCWQEIVVMAHPLHFLRCRWPMIQSFNVPSALLTTRFGVNKKILSNFLKFVGAKK